jgi:hypothetical protein
MTVMSDALVVGSQRFGRRCAARLCWVGRRASRGRSLARAANDRDRPAVLARPNAVCPRVPRRCGCSYKRRPTRRSATPPASSRPQTRTRWPAIRMAALPNSTRVSCGDPCGAPQATKRRSKGLWHIGASTHRGRDSAADRATSCAQRLTRSRGPLGGALSRLAK